MPEQGISLVVAFAAGLVSFVSPCVLPLIPAYITNLTGVSLSSPKPSAATRLVVFSHALAFVVGFSVVFVAFWASVGLLGYLVPSYVRYIRIVGGAVLILMGFHFTGLWHIPFLEREARGEMPVRGHPSRSRSFLTGVIFAAGWTPCIGPVLAGIIGLAALRETVWEGTSLLVAYSAGLAIPFLATALAMGPVLRVLRGARRLQRWLPLFTGLFLILVGLLMMTNLFILIPRYFYWGAL